MTTTETSAATGARTPTGTPSGTNAGVRVGEPVDEATLIAAEPGTDGVPARSAQKWADIPALRDVLHHLPQRDLDPEELIQLASSIAAAPELWREHVAFDDIHRHYVSLHRDQHVDIWILCWTPSNDTGWHDHDISSGAVAVVQGCITEHNLAVHTPSLATAVQSGAVFGFGPDHIHRMTGRDAASVTIHAYSPPLWRMGQYTLGAGGVLHRTSVSYADELRPLDDMA